MRRIVLITPFADAELQKIKDAFSTAEVAALRTAGELNSFQFAANDVLVTYGTGVIVPRSILDRLVNPGYNFHPGPPEYPGLDPHYLAIYDGVRTYGATAHFLTQKIDAGPIVGVERVAVPPGCRPLQLLGLGNEASLSLLSRLGPKIAAGLRLEPLEGVKWQSRRSSARSFAEACTISPLMSQDEFALRRAVFNDGSPNLRTIIHGHRFDINLQEAIVEPSPIGFTEEDYAALLQGLLSAGYKIVPCAEFDRRSDELLAALHHDVVYSAHRAYRLAKIAAEMGVRASFFIDSRSSFFDFRESGIVDCLIAIRAHGHEIGFHTAIDDLMLSTDAKAAWQSDRDALTQMIGEIGPGISLGFRGDRLSDAAGSPRPSGSTSRLVLSHGRWWCQMEAGGSWSRTSINKLSGCRCDRLAIVLDPAWCTPTLLSAHACIERCVMGRARAVFRDAGLNDLHFNEKSPFAK